MDTCVGCEYCIVFVVVLLGEGEGEGEKRKNGRMVKEKRGINERAGVGNKGSLKKKALGRRSTHIPEIQRSINLVHDIQRRRLVMVQRKHQR
jgi:hypothetical protein